jgi:histidine ammonia-lyase
MVAVALGKPLSLSDIAALAAGDAEPALPRDVRAAVARSRETVVSALAAGAVVYGVNTGFGKLANVSIPAAELGQLQRNLILSHATGVGEPLPDDVVRLALALRVHNLALGYSGVRPELLDAMLAFARAGLLPVIPGQGSVGASGDLAPLAHLALPLLGFGDVRLGGAIVPAEQALRAAGLAPVALAAKEGLALINGTQIMTAHGLVTLLRAQGLAKAADIACATTVEALRGSAQPFGEAVHALRPHSGQQRTAANLRALLADSAILPSHKDCAKVQDAYSLRCAPQVHGATKDAVAFALRTLLVEANSVTDNPLVFPDGDVISAGNFHGQPVSQALDVLAIGMATLANISERRIENLVNPDISGLPPFLAAHPGLESGYMIPQVVAAALASENKTLAHPASVDSIPTSANREDHVSMGVTAARHAAAIVENTTRVLAIELLCAVQGLDCGEPLAPGRGVRAAYGAVRELVPPLREDRYLAPDLRAVEELLVSGALVDRVEATVGPLHGD